MHRTFLSIYVIICLSLLSSYAQEQHASISNELLKIRILPFLNHYPDATDIIQKAITNKSGNNYIHKPYHQFDFYQKTSVDIVVNKDTFNNQIDKSKARNDFLAKQIIKPFEPWFDFARPTKNPEELALNILIYEDYKSIYADNINKRRGSIFHATQNNGFFETIGQQNISYLLDEMFGDVDFYKDENEMLLLSFKSPLAKDALKSYTYRFTGTRQINGETCSEIAFFAENKKENTLSGYLYISTDGKYSLIKTKFSLNNPESTNFLKDILITQTYASIDSVRIPTQKEYMVMLGNETSGSIIVERTCIYSDFDFNEIKDKKNWKNSYEKDYTKKDETYWKKIRPIPLTPSQEQLNGLLDMAAHTHRYVNIQNGILILLNNHFSIGGINGKVELGPLTEFISYNKMEGVRLKIGGNTTVKLMERLTVGGYVAYGTDDEKFKYRGDLTYSLLPRNKYIWEYPKRLLSFTYVSDLNIPGQDLLTTKRDNFLYSFSHASTNNMSLQRIGLLTFENEEEHQFSYKIGSKITYDNPQGVLKYMQVQGTDTTIIPSISTSEVSLSLRYAPGEKFIQTRDKRVYLRRGNLELDLNHRIGIKDLFGSDYNYQITELKSFKKFMLPNNSGSIDTRLSAGIVWNRVPYPLLFIPEGNQSYVYQPEGYNCMNFSEFTTDRYIAGNADFMFNWSPFKLFYKKDKMKTSLGGRVIYGPLSDNNNPELHPELFVLDQGIRPLGNTPYAEVNIGIANILKVFRIEYVRRLTYLDSDKSDGGHKPLKGSILFSGSFSF